ncbi:MAG TPA: putative oxidoreductase C-terminal domain-containing protein [Flavitalea sp.]|nr:putative oxidoreductase C-terminal domain-containing protein [Flavitalea sp.]
MAFHLAGCASDDQDPVETKPPVTLITLDPGHFHAALVQKITISGIDSNVFVYAPEGPDLNAHLDLIKQFNGRNDKPTHWDEQVYTGNDFLSKMLKDKKGNVVVLAGNNRQKTAFIQQAVDSGLNVLADKPMAINSSDFELLQKSFADAQNKNVLLYDIMTERSEITNILQRELARDKDIFGELKPGTAREPSVVFENIHYFFKQVSGKDLIRPAWFFDPEQQGEAIADVGTHLVDLVQWECFPDQAIDYKKDVKMLSSRLWPTPLTLEQFAKVTKTDSFPDFLKKYVKDDRLNTHANGELNYTINGKHIRVVAKWNFQAEEGGDSHYSMLDGTKGKLVIQQRKEEKFRPTLTIYPEKGRDKKDFDSAVQHGIERIAQRYQGVNIERHGDGYTVMIPDQFKVGHEAHFSQVMERYLDYLQNHSMPGWEIPCMIAKYYITTKGVELASKK